jgi:hypothetical protein
MLTTIRTTLTLLPVFIECVVFVLGCGDATDTADGGSFDDASPDSSLALDTSTDDIATESLVSGDASGDASLDYDGDCIYVDGGAPYVVAYDVPSALPSATGGELELGRYYAQSYTIYTGDGGAAGPDPVLSDHSRLRSSFMQTEAPIA